MSTASNRTLNRTFTGYKSIDEITLSHVRQMHLVHQHAYPDVSLDDFIGHMSTQSGAVLVRRKVDRLIVGFSVVRMSTQRQGRTLTQGPLVIHEAYRHLHSHARVLQMLVWSERLKRPFTPLRVVNSGGACTPALTAAQAAAQAAVSRAQHRHVVRASSV
jgi:hypothetical protein